MKKAANAKLPKRVRSKNPIVILKAVIRAITEEPKRYDQSVFRSTRSHSLHRERDFPACGTICCVAGWVNTLTGDFPKSKIGEWDTARQTLALEKEEAMFLFDMTPDGVRNRNSVTPRQHAADGVKHIKRFVLKKWGKKI